MICMKLSTRASFSFLFVCSLERNAGKVYSWGKTKEKKTFVRARTYKTYLFFDLNLLEFFFNFFESSALELQIKMNSFNAILVSTRLPEVWLGFLTNCNTEPFPSWRQQLRQILVAGEIIYYAESQQMVQTCLKSSKQTCFYIWSKCNAFYSRPTK